MFQVSRLFVKLVYRFFPSFCNTCARELAEQIVSDRLKSDGIDPDRYAFKNVLIDREVDKIKSAAGLIRPE
jgi:hypothetical protein